MAITATSPSTIHSQRCVASTAYPSNSGAETSQRPTMRPEVVVLTSSGTDDTATPATTKLCFVPRATVLQSVAAAVRGAKNWYSTITMFRLLHRRQGMLTGCDAHWASVNDACRDGCAQPTLAFGTTQSPRQGHVRPPRTVITRVGLAPATLTPSTRNECGACVSAWALRTNPRLSSGSNVTSSVSDCWGGWPCTEVVGPSVPTVEVLPLDGLRCCLPPQPGDDPLPDKLSTLQNNLIWHPVRHDDVLYGERVRQRRPLFLRSGIQQSEPDDRVRARRLRCGAKAPHRTC